MSVQKINDKEVQSKHDSSIPKAYEEKWDPIYEEENVNMKDFVIGALIGGIVGAAAGLLLAPKPGKDLRSDVAIQALSAKDKTVQLSKQLQEQSSQLVEKVKTLKPAKDHTVFDDGTVSSEGEEPLEQVVENINEDVAIVEDKVIEEVLQK